MELLLVRDSPRWVSWPASWRLCRFIPAPICTTYRDKRPVTCHRGRPTSDGLSLLGIGAAAKPGNVHPSASRRGPASRDRDGFVVPRL